MAQKDDKTQSPEELFKGLGIDPSTLAPELQQLYKSMQADYTRKTQALAEERKTLTQEMAQTHEALGAYKKETESWRQWYAGLEKEVGQTQHQPEPKADDKLDLSGDITGEHVKKLIDGLKSDIDAKINALGAQVAGVNDVARQTTDTTARMFSYQAQLADIVKDHSYVDKKELLDYARQNGIVDLERAFKEKYFDKILEEKVTERVEEEKVKLRTSGILGQGRQVIIKPRENVPKTFEEATQQIISEKAAKGTLD